MKSRCHTTKYSQLRINRTNYKLAEQLMNFHLFSQDSIIFDTIRSFDKRPELTELISKKNMQRLEEAMWGEKASIHQPLGKRAIQIA